MFHRWRSAAPLGLLLALCGLLVGGQPALALCNPGRTNDHQHYWDGFWRNPGSQVGGVYANLTQYAPYVNYIDTSGWVMINRLDANDYAQIGYLYEVGSPGPITGFAEYNDTGINGHQYQEFSIPGSWPVEFKVLYGNTPGQFTFYANGTKEMSHCTCFTPIDSQMNGELQSQSDQMLGGWNGNHMVFANAHIYLGGWQAYSGTQDSSNQSIWGNTIDPSGLRADIWDWACGT
jgi:hypothetical protein